MIYLWEKPEWPQLRWDASSVSALLARTSREQGRLLGRTEALGLDLRAEAHLTTLTEDVVTSSEIEGENLARDQVRSSIARRLGMDVGGGAPAERPVEGIVEMVLDATANYAQKLTDERLFGWHAALFPTGRSGMRKIVVGAWRDDGSGPIQVVSGPVGREKVHFKAPPAVHVPDEMTRFLRWFADPGSTDPLLVAGLAHLWFVTIHPFDDGNGRIARAVADIALARSENTGQRFYSMSAQIRREFSDYYATLEQAQKGEPDVTRWQQWFLSCLLRAIEGAHEALGSVLNKAGFWDRFAKEPLNKRQIMVLKRLLGGFEGKLTTSEWAALAQCSQDTAYRDMVDLVERGALKKGPGRGRSTSYSLILD
jgi:Fic family protein